jgi:hypothetical protein
MIEFVGSRQSLTPFSSPHFLHEKRRLSSNTGLIFAGSVLFSIGYVGPTLVTGARK